MSKNRELKINKIDKSEKTEKLDIQGQGCWDDCRMYYGNTALPKCELKFTAYTSLFL